MLALYVFWLSWRPLETRRLFEAGMFIRSLRHFTAFTVRVFSLYSLIYYAALQHSIAV